MSDFTLDTIAREAQRVFTDVFMHRPRWLAATPGRVNLIGEHTDYNQGFVLPLAINRHLVIAAALAEPSAPRALRIHSAALGSTLSIPLDAATTAGDPPWTNYLRGVAWGFAQHGNVLPALDMAIVSDIPLGGGLASSAALEVAMATLLEAVSGKHLDPHEKARICRQAEHDFAGVPCGVMDQLVTVLGDEAGALLIDCRSEEATLVPMDDPDVGLLICNSNIRHALADGAYEKRRNECFEAARLLGIASLRDASIEMSRTIKDPVIRQRATHIVTENARTLATAALLEKRDFPRVGELMYESHNSLRDDFAVSCRELDHLVEIAAAIGMAGGVFGSRMTGGGFGGCTVSLVRTADISDVKSTLEREYTRRSGLAASTFVARPARGTHMVDPEAITG